MLETGERVIGAEAARRFLGIARLPEAWKPEVALYVTNDLPDEWRGTVRWSLETLGGEVLTAGEEAVTVPALSSARVCTLDFSAWVSEDNRREVVLVYELWQGDERLSLSVLPFVPDKHLALTDPEMEWAVRETAEGFVVEVTARRLARFVWLKLEGADVVFSDNYFDLPAGRTVQVTLPAPEGWTIEQVREALRVFSLADTF